MREKVFLLIIAMAAIVLFISFLQEPPEPTYFVDNKTVSNYSTPFFDYEIVRYPSNVEIRLGSDVVLGFVTEPWNLNFGIIPGNGSYSTRSIEIKNKEEKNIEIILKSYGNISDLIGFSQNNFMLEPQKVASVDITLYSRDFGNGNYTGEIDLIAKKPIYNFLSIS